MIIFDAGAFLLACTFFLMNHTFFQILTSNSVYLESLEMAGSQKIQKEACLIISNIAAKMEGLIEVSIIYSQWPNYVGSFYLLFCFFDSWTRPHFRSSISFREVKNSTTAPTCVGEIISFMYKYVLHLGSWINLILFPPLALHGSTPPLRTTTNNQWWAYGWL